MNPCILSPWSYLYTVPPPPSPPPSPPPPSLSASSSSFSSHLISSHLLYVHTLKQMLLQHLWHMINFCNYTKMLKYLFVKLGLVWNYRQFCFLVRSHHRDRINYKCLPSVKWRITWSQASEIMNFLHIQIKFTESNQIANECPTGTLYSIKSHRNSKSDSDFKSSLWHLHLIQQHFASWS